MNVVELEQLSKCFGRQKAVDQIDLSVRAGEIYGFLGPNGAGKSTTIRMLLDLIRPSSGQVRLFGHVVGQAPHVLERVGSLVDGGTFYPFLSARQNLSVVARLHGRADAKRIDAMLEAVGLAGVGRKPLKGYSTGMRQRLGVAAALLGDPELVILDEPTNGLDAAGIGEMRTLIRRLAKDQGRTVFLCSHLLNEVEQVCDRVAIVARGRVVREAVVSDLLQSSETLRVEARPLELARELIAARWPVELDGEGLAVAAPRAAAPAIVEALVEGGADVFHVSARRQSLEEAFMAITAEAG